MYKRLVLITFVILVSLAGLCLLGFHSLRLHAQGLEGRRLAEFSSVADQIRRDVKRKFDAFVQAEQQRPYTDYQYWFVPQTVNQQQALLRSPLAASPDNGLAYGYFQIESDGTITTPHFTPGDQPPPPEFAEYMRDVEDNLLATLETRMPVPGHLPAAHLLGQVLLDRAKDSLLPIHERAAGLQKDVKSAADKAQEDFDYESTYPYETLEPQEETESKELALRDRRNSRSRSFKITIFERQQQVRVENRPRENVEQNTLSNVAAQSREQTQEVKQPATSHMAEDMSQMKREISPAPPSAQPSQQDATDEIQRMVQVRIEPFVPVLLPTSDSTTLGGRLFLLRHVQIESTHLLQGFMINETSFIHEIADSAERLVRDGMGYTVTATEDHNAAYSAILDFGFGRLVVNLMEKDSNWLSRQIGQLRNWYFAIITVVVIATLVALAGLWNSLAAQVRLARKKDDFISAVSHELRTPLTSIRMYTEMLEKGWISSDDKRREYYAGMRHESERLSRLIENVLDFSRIQRGRKKYSFQMGDINDIAGKAIETMKPFAHQSGFEILAELGDIPETSFDSDAVMQILINLLDNAIKYARDGKDKRIIVRTRRADGFLMLEVEDHGPGIPRLQRKKVFEQFYRCQDESTREAAGTGLGLALVKRFAEAHRGFVEILTARPRGTLIRVSLSASP